VALPHLGRRPFRDRSDGWLEFRAGDERWIVAHRQIAGTPWTVAVASPLGVFLAPIHRVGQISLILVLVVLSAASTGIYLGTRRFRHSLASLTDASEAFSAGDLERRVRVSTEDEMGALGQAFNRMAQQLRAQIDRREENARLESFNRLSAAVAHDLKGTLFSLSLLVENMDRHSGDPQFLRDSAETIRSTVERMKKISAKLSERRPRAELERRHVDLAALLRRALRESGADGRDDVRVETDLSGVPEISADPAQIERLFLNLLHNALEAMPEGGTLRLTATMPQPGWVAVQLEDTGMGMRSEFTEQQLFRPFSSTKSGGIGLGLYTGKQIVEHHGGRIEVTSRPSQGTRFTVHLPTTAPEVG
jgi:signal transduction histidine kinase